MSEQQLLLDLQDGRTLVDTGKLEGGWLESALVIRVRRIDPHPPLGAYQVGCARSHQIGSVHKMGDTSSRAIGCG